MTHSFRFPGESDSYRQARNQLLQAEIELRRHVEQVAALRRQLPPGGKVPEDYVFEESSAGPNSAPSARPVTLSQLFQPGKDTLAIYSFMYGPEMKAPCPMCSSIIDALNTTAVHASQRMNLAVVAKSPLERILTFACQRGWDRLRLLSSGHNHYNRDYYGEDAKGAQRPSLNIFVRRNGEVYHSYHSELNLVPPEPSQNERHVDMIWPLWNLLDFTPEGRGTDWYPSLNYR